MFWKLFIFVIIIKLLKVVPTDNYQIICRLFLDVSLLILSMITLKEKFLKKIQTTRNRFSD